MSMIDKLTLREMRQMLHLVRVKRRNPEFRSMVINGYDNADYLHLLHRGDSVQNRIVYHIPEYGRQVGFFAELLYLLMELYFADQKGILPYVSWGEGSLYFDVENVAEKNVFQYYFEQVSELKEREVFSARNVILAEPSHIRYVQNELNTHGYLVAEEYLTELSRIYSKYIRYNEMTKRYLEDSFEHLIGEHCALGVHYRGTDFRRQYNNHPTYFSVEEEIERVKDIMNEGNYELVFLATDESVAVSKFREAFGEKLVFFSDVFRADEGDESVAYSKNERKNHQYLLGLEVLRDQYVLSRCSGLVGGISNITISAQIVRKSMGREYQDLIIMNSQINKNDNQFCDAKH